MKKPLLLAILDGFGINESDYGNAIKAANTPNLTDIFTNYPHTQIGASGMDVGLPDGQMGNSEVGHTNIGAGRIVYQELTRISKAIDDGDFFENPILLKAIDNAINNNSALHLMGLLSDGGVHSHNSHLYALLKLAKDKGLKKVYIHALLDGRDVPPESGLDYVADCVKKCEEIGVGQIATVMGRYYAMDRDNRWERVELAYNAIANGEGEYFSDPVAAVSASYAEKVTDEFVVPVVCIEDFKVEDNDSFIFFNFRPDRAREITRTLVDPAFDSFTRKRGLIKLFYVCMTQYDKTMPNVSVAFMPQSLKNIFGEYISEKGLTQLRIAETEKYAHVTFFFNGGTETVFKGEDRVLIASPKVATYDMQPEMSAYEVCDAVVDRINSGNYDVIILNFANCDMVGHTGVFEAAVKAVEAVDECMGKIKKAILDMEGIMLVTADHGNADKMYEPDGSPFTAHTTNPVPFAVVGKDCELRVGGRLCDICPTMLKILDLPQPTEMTGESLIK
jgi:2,3-bisphosphoglycerate-independent phosphoglycerate mutase